MKENFDDGVEEWWPMKKGKLIIKLKDEAGVDNQDIAKTIIKSLVV